ncbi:hypothetical protein GYMLUDRAFT_40461 [Collybiopsis luxurians FD-317 M1]|uniref:Uncharacterized protein n=1 Tax=Collybiopsis luxurians FD-317 M1 TaxID=944289 RepID=A0A0D0BJ31_9AGAR|nr:hypothetical protein GYMLUDRAFT_40461 [Collybiopsis luxurians FD-317 M1]
MLEAPGKGRFWKEVMEYQAWYRGTNTYAYRPELHSNRTDYPSKSQSQTLSCTFSATMMFSIVFMASNLLCGTYAHPSSLAEPVITRNNARSSNAAAVNDVLVVTNPNWAGVYIESPPAGQNFQTVFAQFTVPTPSKTANGAAGSAAIWVGIDGVTAGTPLLQTGIDIGVSASGVTSFSAWYEWLPGPSFKFNELDIHAGDVIIASVEMINSTTGTVGIENISTGNESAIVLSAPSPQSTLTGLNAEWIVEDFESAGGVLVPFANFTPVTFKTGAFTNRGVSVDPSTSGTTVNIQQNGTVLTSVSVQTDTITVKHT